MAEITESQWDELFHKVDEMVKFTEEAHKSLDSKLNAKALKYFGIRYQWLLVILGVFGLILAGVGIQVTLSLSLMKDVQYLVAIHSIQSERPHIRSHNKEFYRKQPILQSIEPDKSPAKLQKPEPVREPKLKKTDSL